MFYGLSEHTSALSGCDVLNEMTGKEKNQNWQFEEV